jgi:hypothetical protein
MLIVLVSMGIAVSSASSRCVDANCESGRWNRFRRRPPNLSSRSHDRVCPRVSCARAGSRRSEIGALVAAGPLGRLFLLAIGSISTTRRTGKSSASLRLGVFRSAHPRARARRAAPRTVSPLRSISARSGHPLLRPPRDRADHLRRGRGEGPRTFRPASRPSQTSSLLRTLAACSSSASLWFAAPLATSRVDRTPQLRR